MTLAVIYNVAVSLLACFFFWLLIPTLDRIRDKLRERTANAPLTPEVEAAMFKQLRMQQASLKRLEQFRANPRDALLYVITLLSAGLFFFSIAVFLYPFRVETQSVCILPAVASLLVFLMATLEANNMTDRKIDHSMDRLKKAIGDAKVKLKIMD